MRRKQAEIAPLRLRIEPIVARAEQSAQAVQRDLSDHEGLLHAASGIARAAREAERVSQQLRKPFSFSRLPAYFLILATICLAAWCYRHFFHVTRLTIALPDQDALDWYEGIEPPSRVMLRRIQAAGSPQAATWVSDRQVDLAFVQGGVAIPPELPRVETPRREWVLFFLREQISGIDDVRKLITSRAGEGSHRVAEDIVRAWGRHDSITFVHDWQRLTGPDPYDIPPDVDGVLVVKDPADDVTRVASRRLATARFDLVDANLGAVERKLPYLQRTVIRRGYVQVSPPLPQSDVGSYTVATYLVARPGLSPRLLRYSAGRTGSLTNAPTAGFDPDVASTSDLLQGMEAFLSILVYIGLAFLALLGIEMMTYRRRFNELDSLISLISMHQSNKDVLGVHDPHVRSSNLLYLTTCSDLLGLISVIAGYYSQENASLLYNNLLNIIHERSSGLKLNIQLKILHAMLEIAPPSTSDRSDGQAAAP